ncbi:MAG TPA: hypothetical protein DDW24_06705 [Blastocatellia bacterium]|nr:hypothetical protein [Blastocatellia bacterium]
MSAETIKIELNSDEALILFELLSRYSDTDELAIEDQAEQRVMWNLCCDLEKLLIEPFSNNYREMVVDARSRIRDSKE